VLHEPALSARPPFRAPREIFRPTMANGRARVRARDDNLPVVPSRQTKKRAGSSALLRDRSGDWPIVRRRIAPGGTFTVGDGPLVSARQRRVGTAADLMARLHLVAICRADGMGPYLAAAVGEATDEILLAGMLVRSLDTARVSTVEGSLTFLDRLFQQQLLDAVFVELSFRVCALRGLAVPIAVVPRVPAQIFRLLAVGYTGPSRSRLRRRHFVGRSVDWTATDGRAAADHDNHDSHSFHRLFLLKTARLAISKLSTPYNFLNGPAHRGSGYDGSAASLNRSWRRTAMRACCDLDQIA
jgi:hypothetical protein